ncbi:MAG: 4-alpha-glucanotransferase [Clostridia bacterium]|nr:4-alpha-glucanotransferase [Clostridia bacterium]
MRKSGVLMHITSLPSLSGIGTLGDEAYHFVDWLKKAGFSVWQVLPAGPTGYGDSPYQSPSSFAGNIYLIDPELLRRDGLLGDDLDSLKCNHFIDYEITKSRRYQALKMSFFNNYDRLEVEVDEFISRHPEIGDYALFMAVRDYFGGLMWTIWPDVAIRMREESALKHYERILKEEINFYKYTQYLFFRQWKQLKAYANKNGITIFGDMPIYAAEDSADTWANPEIFQLDKDRRPVKVAGVPPDYFSEDGQLWGNPLYDWEKLKHTNYDWWIKRLKSAMELYDQIRIDHFIGFANYYAVRAGAENARVGRWEKAPGRSFFFNVKRRLPDINIVAEDLGVISTRVRRLLSYAGYPGMKVLSFAFDSDEQNPHFLSHIDENSVVYTGTHDNDTVIGWWEKASDSLRAFADEYLPQRDTITERMIEAALGSAARLAVIPVQDILEKDSSARMNTPGTIGNPNWRWNMEKGALTDELAEKYRELNEYYERIPS